MRLSDKPFMGSVTAHERAKDTIDMAKIIFGEEFDKENTVMISLINGNSLYDDGYGNVLLRLRN
jgi:Trimethylamine:corrinoid methyltransferase